MGKDSKITWCDDTHNPWIGCTEVSIERTGGGGCDNCYARVLDARYKWGGATHWGAGVPRKRSSASARNEVMKWAREAAEPGYVGVSGPGRRLVFCASLADVFDNEVDPKWRDDLWDLIANTDSLTWLLLTKRIGNVMKMLPPSWHQEPWDHVWIGASVVNQKEADRDMPTLLDTPAHKRFISYEPVLGAVDLLPFLSNGTGSYKLGDQPPGYKEFSRGSLSWVIVGGESGAKRRPMDMDAARRVIEDCRAFQVPVFVKQDSAFFPGQQGRFTPEEFNLKEFPK